MNKKKKQEHKPATGHQSKISQAGQHVQIGDNNLKTAVAAEHPSLINGNTQMTTDNNKKYTYTHLRHRKEN
jgi:hypothetical protein